MKELIFKTNNKNQYLFLNNNIILWDTEAQKDVRDMFPDADDYYARKLNFLKENLAKEEDNVSFQTQVPPQVIEENIANLKQLLIEVTDGCNLACEYCGYGKLYNNYDKRMGKMQSFEKVRVLLDFLIEKWQSLSNYSYKNQIYIGFYGGEPLLNFKLIRQIIDYLAAKEIDNIDFQYNMTTNAVLLDKHMDYLKENKVHLLISIDGNKENHSYRITPTGENSFDKVYSNILKLKNKYPTYYDEYVSFNSVLHNRNSSYEIAEFIEKELGKTPKISELSKVGISKEKHEEFDNMFRAKFDSSDKKIETKEDSDAEYLLNNPRIAIFNLFVDSFIDNTYNDLQDFFEYQNNDTKYYPTGTCLPFQKKMFLTVNGKILPCEKVGQEVALGHVDHCVHLDYENISGIYSDLYSQITKSCHKCFTWNNCGQCLFLLKGKSEKLTCDTICSLNRACDYLSANMTMAETHPFLYNKIVNELTNK